MEEFSRDIINELEKWMARENRKPLVLRGARQVGKTSVVNIFGQRFDNYLYVNLDNEQVRTEIERTQNVQDLIQTVFIQSGQMRRNGKTLIFFDEIQNSSKVVGMLRYFYEQEQHLYVIAAGSLLESMIDRHISFPVGRVEYLAMHPVSYREYLSACGEYALRALLEQDFTRSSIYHERLMKEFNMYALIGGMPEVVQHYIKHQDIYALDTIYDTLLTGFADDVEKYASNKTQVEIIRHVITVGMLQAGQQIAFQHFGNSNYKSREMGEAMRTLEKAMLIELCYPVTTSIQPAIPNHSRAPKLLWLDMGLVSAAAHNKREVFTANSLFDIWKGAYAEQVVGQELLTLSNRVMQRRVFWVNKNSQSAVEVDFLYEYNGRLVPIEVKLGHNAHLRSLHQFMDSSPNDVAIRIWNNPFSIDDVITPNNKSFRLVNIPFYLVGHLPQILEKI